MGRAALTCSAFSSASPQYGALEYSGGTEATNGAHFERLPSRFSRRRCSARPASGGSVLRSSSAPSATWRRAVWLLSSSAAGMDSSSSPAAYAVRKNEATVYHSLVRPAVVIPMRGTCAVSTHDIAFGHEAAAGVGDVSWFNTNGSGTFG